MISVGITLAMIVLAVVTFMGYVIYEIFHIIAEGTRGMATKALCITLSVLAAVIVGLILYCMFRGLS